MNNKPTIEITFNDKGDPQFEGHNFTGNECIFHMAPFEQALGKVGKIDMKPSLVTGVKQTNKQKQIGH